MVKKLRYLGAEGGGHKDVMDEAVGGQKKRLVKFCGWQC